MIAALKRWMRPKRHAGFCTLPDCPCQTVDADPCDTYSPTPNIAGEMRCARCGHLGRHHSRAARSR